MKYLALILFFAATSAFAEGDKVVWTSDTTYVKAGVEHKSYEKIYFKRIEQKYSDPSDKQQYYYWFDRARKYDINPANPFAKLRFFGVVTFLA